MDCKLGINFLKVIWYYIGENQKKVLKSTSLSLLMALPPQEMAQRTWPKQYFFMIIQNQWYFGILQG